MQQCGGSSTTSPSSSRSQRRSSSTPSAQLPAMEQDVEFLQLRTLLGDAYVHAWDDGRTVRINACQSSYNAVWAVERHMDTDGLGLPTVFIRLRGAYGRYLGAPEKPCRSFPCLRVIAAQRDCDDPVANAITWQVVNVGGMFTLRSKTGCYLEYYSRPLSSSKTRRWNVEMLPRLNEPQPMIQKKPMWVKLLAYLQRLLSSERKINWVLANNRGDTNDIYWGKFLFQGRDISYLEKELSELVPRPTTVCIRAGRYGQPTPLRVNLPRSKEPLHLVLFLKNTAGSVRLMYPDLR